MSEEPVSYVNAPMIARERGVEVALITDADAPSTATSCGCA